MPNQHCSGRGLEEVTAGWDGLRLGRGGGLLTDFETRVDGDAVVSFSFGNCSVVSVARGFSLTGGLVGDKALEKLLGKIMVSLPINVPRMRVASDGTGR